MIAPNNPEIDVNELMERVRQEAAKIRPRDNGELVPRANERRSSLPTLPDMPPPPVLGLSRLLETKFDRAELLLKKARGMIEVSSQIPKMFRGLFRRQGGFNRAALETMQELAKENVKLSKRVRELTIAAEQHNHWLRLLPGQRQIEAAWMRAAGAQLSSLPELLERQVASEEKLTRLEASGDHTTSRIDQLHGESGDLRGRVTQLQDDAEKLTEELSGLHAATNQHEEQIGLHKKWIERHGEDLRQHQLQSDAAAKLSETWGKQLEHDELHLRNLQGQLEHVAERSRLSNEQLERHGEHLRNLQHEAGLIAQDLKRQATLEMSVGKLEERQVNDGAYIKGELSRHNALLHQKRSGTPIDLEGAEATDPASGQDSHRFDPFYLSFENRFRGSRAEIKERIRNYLPIIVEAHAGKEDRPVLDLGCGRGEWLELLQENGLAASGVDLNTAMVDQCRERNLAVTQADAVQFLRQLQEATYGAVTGFHIIEHLPFETLMDLLGETRRVLKPGGLAIFESPNCKNIVVGASNFYSDPTHRNPVFPDTAAFLLETHGFERVWIDYRSPVKQIAPAVSETEPSDFQNWFYGPRDFAVIGYRPNPS